MRAISVMLRPEGLPLNMLGWLLVGDQGNADIVRFGSKADRAAHEARRLGNLIFYQRNQVYLWLIH